MNRRTTRRQFLQQTAVSGIGFWVAGGIALGDSQSPNEQINIACIGVGGKGGGDTEQAGRYGNIVALCDIDDKYLDGMAKKFPKAKKYHDFRKMFDELEKGIDGVTVSTPDHTHAAASILAMKLKKHVYCQKPLTHTIQEARLMRELAKANHLATQMGNQGTASSGLRRGVEVLRAGTIGPVREVHVWTNRPAHYWIQAPDVTERPKGTFEVPKGVHWDLWLGPAPARPYAKYPDGTAVYHPKRWRGWWDFGTGALGDMACHTTNLAFMALKLGLPVSVTAESAELNGETYPAWAKIVYEFPARGDLPPVTLHWYEGKRDGQKLLPPEELLKGQEKYTDSGSLLIGAKGVMYSPSDYGAHQVLLPKEAFQDHKDPEPTLPRHTGGDDDSNQKAEWVRSVKGGPPALSNFAYGGTLTEAMLLGNVAVRVGGHKKLEYDGAHGKITNAPEAEQYLKTEYRKGWSL